MDGKLVADKEKPIKKGEVRTIDTKRGYHRHRARCTTIFGARGLDLCQGEIRFLLIAVTSGNIAPSSEERVVPGIPFYAPK